MKHDEYHSDFLIRHFSKVEAAFFEQSMSTSLSSIRSVLEKVERLLPSLENRPSDNSTKNYHDDIQDCISLFPNELHGASKAYKNPQVTLLGEQDDGKGENFKLPREKTQAVFDEFPFGVSILNDDGKFTYVNPKFTEIFGYKLQEMQSLKEWLIKAYPDKQSCEEAKLVWNGMLKNPRAYKDAPWTSSVVCKDDREKNISIKVKPIDIQSILIVYEDITERYHAEEALRLNEERCRLVLDEMPGVVFRTNADGSFDFIDNKIEDLSGYTREQFHSRSLQWSDIVVEEDLEEILSNSQRDMETVRAYASEYRIRKKDGAIVWVEENGQIFYDIQGKIDHVSGVFFNITSKKAAESFSLQGREPEGLTLNYCNNEVILPDVPKPASEFTSHPMAVGELDQSQSQLTTKKQKRSIRMRAGLLIIPFLIIGSVFCLAKTNFGKERVNLAIEFFSAGIKAFEASAPDLNNIRKVKLSFTGESQGIEASVTNSDHFSQNKHRQNPDQSELPPAIENNQINSAGQKSPDSIDQRGADAVRYVASKTSTKYHHPDCKWVKLIKPEKLLSFSSVKEAKDNDNYLQCPTCKPPLSDSPVTAEKVYD